jgi:trans-2,3-dihydro-3-hydroxyanthranilate isomerase
VAREGDPALEVRRRQGLTLRYQFFLCDVFSDQRFAGNPLAVVPNAQGLSDEQMQQIAREFNFSETTFVLPPEAGHTRKVRIFTPFDEIPFAGHPNIGTAFVLASAGELGRLDAPISVIFEERAGLVPVDVDVCDGEPRRCELAAPEALSLGDAVPVKTVADVLSLSPVDVVTETHLPRAASVGLPFLFAELGGLDALARARVEVGALDALETIGAPLAIHAYVRLDDEFELRARVLIAKGGYEDPATGSANCALAAMLAELDPAPEGELRWRITQGVEMGRPSTLYARAEKRNGRVVSARIAGACAMVGSGFLDLD